MIRKVHEITTGTKLIGISGKAGAGKDTIASYLMETYQNTWRLALADALKASAAAAFGISFQTFMEPGLKELRNPYWEVSPRKIAQFLGTEMFRDMIPKLMPDIGEDFWIRRLTGVINGELDCPWSRELVEYTDQDVVIVPDVRFSNEMEWILENGGTLWHVVRPDLETVGISGHRSELQVPALSQSILIINHTTKEKLYEVVNVYAKSIPQLMHKDIYSIL